MFECSWQLCLGCLAPGQHWSWPPPPPRLCFTSAAQADGDDPPFFTPFPSLSLPFSLSRWGQRFCCKKREKVDAVQILRTKVIAAAAQFRIICESGILWAGDNGLLHGREGGGVHVLLTSRRCHNGDRGRQIQTFINSRLANRGCVWSIWGDAKEIQKHTL
jgi:hypothetical protein